MVAELNVRINSANEYNIDAEGKDLISLDILDSKIKNKLIQDNILVIELTAGKKLIYQTGKIYHK